MTRVTQINPILLNQLSKRLLQVTLLLSVLISGKTTPAIAQEHLLLLPERQIFASNSRSQAQQTFNEGIQQYNQGTATALRQAITQWKKALQLFKAEQNTFQIATTLNHLCHVHADLGEYQTAIDYCRQSQQLVPSLPVKQENEREFWEAQILGMMAQVYLKWGEYQQALEHLSKSRSLWQNVGYKTGEAATFNNLGLVYLELGEFHQAIQQYEQAFSLAKALGNRANIAATLNNRGQVYTKQGELKKAQEDYQQALKEWEAAPPESVVTNQGKAGTWNNLGFVYTKLEQFDLALQAYENALLSWQKVGDPSGKASTLNNQGFVYLQQGKLDKAQDLCRQSLQIRQEIEERNKEVLSLYCLAIIQREQGQLDAARETIEAALNQIEALRTNISRQDFRTSFFATKQEYYEFYIDILMQLHQQNPEQGYDGKALQASERAKARSLLEILAETGGEITSGISPQLLQQKQQIQQQLYAVEELRVQLLKGEYTEEQRQTINQNVEVLLQQYQDILSKIRTNSQHYAALTQPQPLTLKEIQSLLDSDTVLLEYALGEKQSYLWVVTSDSLESYKLPPREKIETAVRKYRNSFLLPTQRFRRNLAEEVGKELTQLILPDLTLLSNQRLLIVADGSLQYLPFNALPVPGNLILTEDWQPLIINHEIVTIPSASTLGILRQEFRGRTPAPKTIAIFADPVFSYNDDRIKEVIPEAIKPLSPELERAARESGVLFDRLPFTQQEAEQILALVPPSNRTQQFGFSARREVLNSSQLNQYQILHFATHGLLNSQTPELSGLVLSLVDETGKALNGFLRLYDVFNLKLGANLAVLSACETGLGEDVKGEGLVGLTRGFMYAGIPQVVVSLWKVDDQATALLMVKFYQRMLKQGLSPAAALREAQIEMWQENKWKSPYYWAAFTLQGDFSHSR